MKPTSLLLTLALIFSLNAFAASKELKIQGDLMIHPDQIAQFFAIAASKIGTSSTWDWPQLNFTKPYKTSWAQVVAKGPFEVQFQTADLSKQEVGFELTWNDPVINVGRFEVHDTITRSIGGADVIINLDGACNDMIVRMPAGNWKVKGTLKYIWTAQGMQASWKDFQFAMGAANTTIDIGQCEGAQALQAELRGTIESVSKDQAWMQDVLQGGVLDWVESSLGTLQGELLKTRVVEVKPGLNMTWRPGEIQQGDKGLMRVSGEMSLEREAATASSETLSRTYAVSSLMSVKESGFLFPNNTLQKIVGFLQASGDLGYRLNSNDVSAFKGLMESRFMQFFVWPDLMSFKTDTAFYFDISASSPPVLSGGHMLEKGGISFDVEAPLLVRQWAPAKGVYVPYMDFSSPMQGQLTAKVSGGNLVMQIVPNQLQITNKVRSEYSKVRQVNGWIATSLLGSQVSSSLQEKPFSLAVPTFELGGGMSLGLRDVQMWTQSFRIPLEFKSNK